MPDTDSNEQVDALGFDYLDAQPHAAWKVLREHCPVKPLPVPEGDTPVYMVMRHDDIESVFRDPATYSSAIHNETIGPVMGEIILGWTGRSTRTIATWWPARSGRRRSRSGTPS